MKSLKLKIKGMHCTSCAFNIDGELEDTEGIKSSQTSYARQETEVEFDESKINMQKIIDIVKKVGYDVNPLN